MANLNLEPGDSSFDEMISSVKKGIFMQTNALGRDDFRNKFQFGCEYAQLIEDGKITKTVKNPNYRAISTPFWNSLKKLAIWILLVFMERLLVKENQIKVLELVMQLQFAFLII